MIRIPPCADCGAHVHIRARGRCDSCYEWQRRHGWDAVRPVPPTACRACGRSWRESGKNRGRGLCPRCYQQDRREAKKVA